MKHILIAAAASAMLMAACGDDSSTNANGSSSNGSSFSGSSEDGVFSRTASLYVNEAEHSFIMSVENWEDMMCVVEGDNYTWKKVNVNIDPDTSIYDFHGDTLVLYDVYNGKPDYDYGDLLVGGTAGNLYGKWTFTGCDYNNEEGTTECYKSQKYYNRTLTFSKGKVKVDYQIFYDLYKEDHSDYMNSYFMAQVLRTLGGSYPEAYLYEIWYIDSSSVQSSVERTGAVFTSKTKTNATFEMGEKRYTVNVKHADMSLQTEGYFAANENKDVQVEVSDGVTVCTAESFSHYMDANFCKAEYKENLRTDEWEYSNHEKFIAAEKYSTNNENDFEQCIAGIAAIPYDPLSGYTNFAKPLAKKAGNAVRANDAQSREERSLHKWAKYAR